MSNIYFSAQFLKCYKCSGTSLENCETNQKVQDCENSVPCGTLKLVIAFNGNPTYTNYIKTCAPLANCTRYFNSTGMVLSLYSCQMITRCSTDYCNGEPPTTSPLVTSGILPETTDSKLVTERKTSAYVSVSSSILPTTFSRVVNGTGTSTRDVSAASVKTHNFPVVLFIAAVQFVFIISLWLLDHN